MLFYLSKSLLDHLAWMNLNNIILYLSWADIWPGRQEAVVAKILGGSQSGEKTSGKKLFSHSDSQSNAS